MAATPELSSPSSSSNFFYRLVSPILRFIRNSNQYLHFIMLLFAFLVFTIYSKLAKNRNPNRTRKSAAISGEPEVDKAPELEEIESSCGSDPTRIEHSVGSGSEKGKKKKRVRKKRPDSNVDEKKKIEELVCFCPFTTSSSATQRRIKQSYDELVRCHHSNALTLAQVEQFVNCLIETRNELEHKSEVIQRRFTITKALLHRADRSSMDRLRQQIYKLEFEQKRLEEDAFVYNWLQQQLKLSPAYKKMIEVGACMETKAKSGKIKDADAEFADISFEELLAQEKKDVYWQRIGKSKQCCS